VTGASDIKCRIADEIRNEADYGSGIVDQIIEANYDMKYKILPI